MMLVIHIVDSNVYYDVVLEPTSKRECCFGLFFNFQVDSLRRTRIVELVEVQRGSARSSCWHRV